MAATAYRLSPMDPSDAKGPEVKKPTPEDRAPEWLTKKKESKVSNSESCWLTSDLFRVDKKSRVWVENCELVDAKQEDVEKYKKEKTRLHVHTVNKVRTLHVQRSMGRIITRQLRFSERISAFFGSFVRIHRVIVEEE